MFTTAIYKLYFCIIFISLSKHKANTAELHPKVRQTCFHSIFKPYKGNFRTLADPPSPSVEKNKALSEMPY